MVLHIPHRSERAKGRPWAYGCSAAESPSGMSAARAKRDTPSPNKPQSKPHCHGSHHPGQGGVCVCVLSTLTAGAAPSQHRRARPATYRHGLVPKEVDGLIAVLLHVAQAVPLVPAVGEHIDADLAPCRGGARATGHKAAMTASRSELHTELEARPPQARTTPAWRVGWQEPGGYRLFSGVTTRNSNTLRAGDSMCHAEAPAFQVQPSAPPSARAGQGPANTAIKTQFKDT